MYRKWSPEMVLLAAICVQTLAGRAKDKQTLITVHVYQKSWNDAQFICEDQGGMLYKADSAEKKLVLTKIRSNTSPSNYAWIGLHSVSQEGNLSWTYGIKECLQTETDFTSASWEDNHPQNLNRCGAQASGTGKWKSEVCGIGNPFICEQDLDDNCEFVISNGSLNDIPSTEYLTKSLTSDDGRYCTSLCLNSIYNSLNCWAAVYDSSTLNCKLCYSNDPFLFTDNMGDQAKNSSTYFFTKTCYKESSMTSSPASGYTSNSPNPDKGCKNVPYVETELVSIRSTNIASSTIRLYSTAARSLFTPYQSTEPTSLLTSFQSTKSTSGSVNVTTKPANAILKSTTSGRVSRLTRLPCRSPALITIVSEDLTIYCLTIILGLYYD